MLAFDHFRLDPETGHCWDGQELVRLSPKAGAVLHYLVTHAGQLVSAAAIRQAAWADGGGSAAALKVYIGEIRKALQDDPHTPRFIETQPRQGYRFIAPLIPSVPAPPNPDPAVGDPLRATPAWSSLLSLVGRDPELRQLQRAFNQALQGERQLVFVSGEPGIGKTTLVNAFLSQLPTQAEAVWVTRGQCVEQYGAGEAYLPLLEALGRLGREADGPEVIAMLAQYAPTWLAQLPALVMPAEREALQQTLGGATRERMLREMAEALEVLTTHRPVVLVLEDLHWSDQSTLELLNYILRRQGSARLLLLGTFRSTEVLDSNQSLRRIVQDVHGRGPSEEMALGLLNEEQVHEYLRTRLGKVEAADLSFHELAQWVHGRTEGNPLFMVTLVEQLQREKVLIETEGVWQIGGAWDQRINQVPDSLRQVIERQFESLSAAEQQLLAVASVVGTEFAVAAVAAGDGQAIEQVEEQCGELAAKGRFLREAGIEEWPDGTFGGRYSFLHALYQNVLYGRVPEVRRVQLHRRIAERKAAAYGERVAEVAAELAMHCEAGREFGQAIQYLRQASEQALRRNAHYEAIRHARKGLELLAPLPATQERAQQELALHVALGPSL